MRFARRTMARVMRDRTDAIRRALPLPVPAAYPPLILGMRFFVEPEISCSRFFGAACFTEASICAYRKTGDVGALRKTELGAFVAERLRDGLFIDIPCGLHAAREAVKDVDVIPLAAALGAREAWEIDITADVVRDRIPRAIDVLDGGKEYVLGNGIGEIGERRQAGIAVSTMQDDLLGCIAKIERAAIEGPLALYVSAVQPDATLCKRDDARRDVVVPYLTALYDELARATRPGDLVILNSSAMLATGVDEDRFPFIHPALALPPRGLALMRRCARDKVHVFAKE
jgi:hypothetical protein